MCQGGAGGLRRLCIVDCGWLCGRCVVVVVGVARHTGRPAGGPSKTRARHGGIEKASHLISQRCSRVDKRGRGNALDAVSRSRGVV